MKIRQLLYLFSFVMLLAACSNLEQTSADNFFDEQVDIAKLPYEQLKHILYQKERNLIKSTDYQFVQLKVKGHKTIWKTFKIKMVIFNRSLITTIKDFKVNLYFYDRSHNFIDSMQITIYKTCQPQQQVYYNVKIRDIPEDLVSVEGQMLDYTEAGEFDNFSRQASFINWTDEIDKVFNSLGL